MWAEGGLEYIGGRRVDQGVCRWARGWLEGGRVSLGGVGSRSIAGEGSLAHGRDVVGCEPGGGVKQREMKL